MIAADRPGDSGRRARGWRLGWRQRRPAGDWSLRDSGRVGRGRSPAVGKDFSSRRWGTWRCAYCLSGGAAPGAEARQRGVTEELWIPPQRGGHDHKVMEDSDPGKGTSWMEGQGLCGGGGGRGSARGIAPAGKSTACWIRSQTNHLFRLGASGSDLRLAGTRFLGGLASAPPAISGVGGRQDSNAPRRLGRKVSGLRAGVQLLGRRRWVAPGGVEGLQATQAGCRGNPQG